MNERPNVTVIYQDPKPATPGLGAVLLELMFFFFMAGVIALIAGSCRMLM